MRPTVHSTGVQSGSTRYGSRYEGAPPLAQWRANLTGLSQVHNLYFVAAGSEILVHSPRFPSQELSNGPLLIFTSDPSAPRLAGYINRSHPHWINNLVVQFLGSEEVVAVVRDDGDVDAFLVRHIVQAIDRRAEAASSLAVRATEIRPFFQRNVGNSARGLAVHTQARIIATSSNAHEVRVFKFGLLHADDDEPDEARLASPNADESSRPEALDSRQTDVTQHILNGGSNIPYISFCNTGDDPNGRWLLTTDIGGACRVMDLGVAETVQSFHFGRLLRDHDFSGFDRHNAGWILMFLDRRSFYQEDEIATALGLAEGEGLPNIDHRPHVWDLSKTVKRLPGHSQPVIIRHAVQQSTEVQGSNPSPSRSEEDPREFPDDGEDDSDGGALLELEIEIDHSLSDSDATSDPEPQDQAALKEPQDGSVPDTQPGDGDGDDQDSTDSDFESESTFASLVEDRMELIDDTEDPDDMTEETISYNDMYSGEAMYYSYARFADATMPLCDDLPCPILHASVRNIYLLQPSDQRLFTGPNLAPMIGLGNPLQQDIQHDFNFLCHFQRLNMVSYMPSLGILAVASQKGRVLVLSLTKTSVSAQSPIVATSRSDRSPSTSARSPRSPKSAHRGPERTIYAMRVECILPFAHQEMANERPVMPLHGIAASPVQGTDGIGAEHCSRWRLMLMYHDHSILTYEIYRDDKAPAARAERREASVEVASLIV